MTAFRPLEGRVVAVTGASRGIGRATAASLAASGAQLALCARSSSALDELRRELEASGTAVHAAQVDVRDPSALQQFVDGGADHFGRLDGLVTCAGVLGPVGPLHPDSLVEWQDALDVNLLGTVRAVAAAVPHLRASGGGAIVTFSGGGVGGPGIAPRISAYTTSKTAVVAFTEAMGTELAPDGIRVNAIAPGAILTDFNAPILVAGPDAVGPELYERTQRQRESPDSLVAYLRLLHYLMSDDASWLTGRLLSAKWETVEMLEHQRATITTTSRFTLRRIDEALFSEIERSEP